MGYTNKRLGNMVLFTDEFGKPHHAIVTADWASEAYPNGAVNLVYVSDDENLTDPYGRQIVRKTSVVHKENQSAHGMFYIDA
jgi:hypothetical protein